MDKRKGSGAALETIQRMSHLLQKEKERLSPSSPLALGLERCVQFLKHYEKEIFQSNRTVLNVGIEFGPKIELGSPERQFLADFRTKLWMRLGRKNESKCK